jgi:putative ABC transport system permease protein
MDAETVSSVAADVVATNRTFTDTFALMLLLGLLVALVAVAAMLVRSALERRTSLAVLRAIGFPRRTVALTVAAEPISVAAVGGLAGLVVGLGVLRLLFAAGFSDLAFVVDLTRIGVVFATVVAALVVVCFAAAWPALPRRPDEALRDVA